MSKTLVYTVSNLSPDAVACATLLHRSLQVKNSEFTFAILTNQACKLTNLPIISASCPTPYVGYLKFSDAVPAGFDQYIYLDSDILCLESLANLHDESHEFSLVEESASMNSAWFAYPGLGNRPRSKMSKLKGINAGSFAFRDRSILAEVRELMNAKLRNHLGLDAQLEQAAFNRMLFLRDIPQSRNFKPLSDIVKLYPDRYSYEPSGKSIYHFCGFSGEMASKFERMAAFTGVSRLDLPACLYNFSPAIVHQYE